jgi:hypothetical protein
MQKVKGATLTQRFKKSKEKRSILHELAAA